MPLRNAMNEVLRDDYVDDCQRGVDRWNKVLAERGISFRFELPSRRFHRHQGIFADAAFDPKGNPLSKEEFEKKKGDWLPSAEDCVYVKSLQAKAVYEPGKMANWMAAPAARHQRQAARVRVRARRGLSLWRVSRCCRAAAPETRAPGRRASGPPPPG